MERPRYDWRFPALVGRAVVGGLFLISAFGKITVPAEFVEEIRAYEMIPVGMSNALGYVLPWLELLTGLLLIFGVWRKEARLIIAAMLVVFTIAKGYTFAQGKWIDCGCGGSVEILKYIYNSPQGILTNIVLLGLLWVDYHAERLARALRGAADQPTRRGAAQAPESV